MTKPQTTHLKTGGIGPIPDISPKGMIEWLERNIEMREKAIHSKNAAKMEKAIRDFIKEHANV